MEMSTKSYIKAVEYYLLQTFQKNITCSHAEHYCFFQNMRGFTLSPHCRLLDCPLRQRRKYINNLFQEKPGYFELAQQLTVEASEASPDNSSTLDRMDTFFRKSCESSCEGIMLKTLDIDAGYSASKRCDSWLKVQT